MSNTLKSLGIAVAALLLTLLVAELAMGLFYRKNIEMLKYTTADMYYYIDREGVRHHIPNKIGYEQHWDNSGKVEIRINSFGYRGKEIPFAKQDNTSRIFFLGDSVTFGTRLPEDDIFIQKLDRLFNVDSKRHYDMINAGVHDAGIDEEFVTLREGVKLKPDLVVLCWYPNDGRPPLGFPEEIVYNNKIIHYLNQQAWLRKSYLAGFLYDRLRRFLISRQLNVMEVKDHRFQWLELYSQARWLNDEKAFAELVDSARFDWGDAWNPVSINKMSEKIGQMDGFLKKKGIRFCVVAFPPRVQVDSKINVDQPQKVLAAYCRKSEVPFFDILPVLREKSNQELYFDFSHLTPVGNELVARELFGFIKKLL